VFSPASSAPLPPKKRDPHAFEHSIEEIVNAVQDALASGITEVHMVGGLHPSLGKEWYLELLRQLRALDPQLQINAFTAIEVRHLARRIFKKTIADTLAVLREAGIEFAYRRGRGNLRFRCARPTLSWKGNGGGMARRSSNLAPNGRPQHLHDALRSYRDQ
jgi:hypothetical protein